MSEPVRRAMARVQELVAGGETDRDAVIDVVAAGLPEGDLRFFARRGVQSVVSAAWRARRSRLIDAPEAREVAVVAGVVPRSRQWGAVRQFSESGALSLYEIQIDVGQRLKRLGECTAGDVGLAVAEYRSRAARNDARAVKFERLAGWMAEHGVQVVRDIPEVELGGILRGALVP